MPTCDDTTLRLATPSDEVFALGCVDNGDGTFEFVRYIAKTGDGNDVYLTGLDADESNNGGNVYIAAGQSGPNGIDGGQVVIQSGIGAQVGGNITIQTGPGGNGRGGDIVIETGAGNNGGRRGALYLMIPDADPHLDGAAYWSSGVLTRSSG